MKIFTSSSWRTDARPGASAGAQGTATQGLSTQGLSPFPRSPRPGSQVTGILPACRPQADDLVHAFRSNLGRRPRGGVCPDAVSERRTHDGHMAGNGRYDVIDDTYFSTRLGLQPCSHPV